MKYYRFELKDDLKGDTKEFLVRRDCVGLWWEQFINELETTAHLTTRGSVDVENDYCPIIKKA